MKSLQSLSQTLFIVALVCGASVSRTAAVQQSQHQRLSATQSVASANSRHLTALPQPAFSINSLHTSPLVNGTSETSSLAGNLTGIKPGLPATCYGQPCSTSACFPAATVAVRQHVNYVNVTAFVELERSYNVSGASLLTL